MHYTFLEKYMQASTEKKIAFLKHLLHADKALQQRFVEFLEQESETPALLSVEDFARAVTQNLKVIAGSLKLIDLENPDWDNYTPSHSGYMKDWETYEDASEQELKAVIDQYQASSIDHLIRQDLDSMYATLFGLYLACRYTEIEDPVPTFDSVNDYLTDTLIYSFRQAIEKIEYAILPAERIHQMVRLLLDYCLHHRKEDSGFLKAVQPLIHALVKKAGKTNLLINLKNRNEIGELLPWVYATILLTSGQQDQWLIFAKQTYSLDPKIAKQLLQFYHDEKDKEHFVPLARELFTSDKSTWVPFLQPLVDIQADKSLYLDIHLKIVSSDCDIETYQKIRPELSTEQVNHLIDAIWDNTFLVKILSLEKRYEDIKQLVKENDYSYDFADIITPILNIYPDFCFRTLKRLIFKQLDNERGRSVYRRIVKKIQLTRQIKGFELSSEKLIQKVYQDYPRLSALRDEMRMGGLI